MYKCSFCFKPNMDRVYIVSLNIIICLTCLPTSVDFSLKESWQNYSNVLFVTVMPVNKPSALFAKYISASGILHMSLSLPLYKFLSPGKTRHILHFYNYTMAWGKLILEANMLYFFSPHYTSVNRWTGTRNLANRN